MTTGTRPGPGTAHRTGPGAGHRRAGGARTGGPGGRRRGRPVRRRGDPRGRATGPGRGGGRAGHARHDHEGSTILPGLVDAHVHLGFDCSEDPRATLGATDPDELARAMARRAGALLSCGVTTARDLGDAGRRSIGLPDAIARGELPGPRLLAATTPLGFFVHIGFDVPEVLDMATTGAAAGLGIADTGVLDEGRRADLLVVDGDPLTDLEALRAPRLVVGGGRVYPGAR